MKYCPICETEYREEIQECAECTARLIDEQTMKSIWAAREREGREVFVKVVTVENKFEADVITNALTKECIPVMVRSYQDTAYDGIFIPQKGWGIIMVPTEYTEKAEKIILEIKETIPQDTMQDK